MAAMKDDPIDLTLEVLTVELRRLRELANKRPLDEDERFAFDTYARHAVAIYRIEATAKRGKVDDLAQMTDDELDAYEAKLRSGMAS